MNESQTYPSSEENQPAKTQIPAASPAENTGSKLVAILTILLFSAVSAAGYFAYQYFQLVKQSANLAPQNQEAPSLYPTSRTQLENSLQDLLVANCTEDDTIEKSLLPFALNASLIEKYGIDNKVPCHWGTSIAGDRINGYIRLENREGNLPVSTLKIGTKDSEDGYYGEEDFVTFDSIEPNLTVENIRVLIDILQPGPYGLSSNGIWLEVRAYKKTGEFLIIAKEFSVVKVEGAILDLMIKHANEPVSEIPDGFPQYTVNQNYEQFKQDFIDTYFASYPNIQPTYKGMIDNTISDANSVSITTPL